MSRITQHPIRSKADALARALLASGFTLLDDNETSEVQDAQWGFALFAQPQRLARQAIALEEDGRYALRTNLLADQLHRAHGRMPLRAFSVGRVFDAADETVPCRHVVEGVIAEEGFDAKAAARTWRAIAQAVYGLAADVAIAPLDEDTREITCTLEGETFPLALQGRASEIARALLGLADSAVDAWIFSIDVDALAQRESGVASRAELYSPVVSSTGAFLDDTPCTGTTFEARAANVLRQHGYREFFGPGLYEQDAYRKMNMIMESWDLNNRGALLQTPFGRFSRVPTVLTPSLEDALEANCKAGEPEARIFEIAHHYLLKKIGTKPVLKTSLSFAAYGPDLDRKAFRREVGEILDELGVKNHFFIPTDMAIPYEPDDCYVILDERMRYLDGNFGSICQKARDAHGIGVPACMAQIEVPALARKSAEEEAFTPPEER